MAKAKARILKLLVPLTTKLQNMKALMMMRKNKVGPIKKDFLLQNDGLSFDHRRDEEYLQARRAILNSYNLSNDRHMINSLKQKMKRSLNGLGRDIVRTRIGVGLYRFILGCPWTSHVLVFRCSIPHLKCKDD